MTTGSTLSIESGTNLYYAKGTIEFANDATLAISATSLVDAAIHGSAQVGQGFINVNNAAKPPLDLDTGTLNLEVDFGRGIIVSGTAILNINKSLSISGHVDLNSDTSATLGITGGTIKVINGVNITLTTSFNMNGGTFQTVDNEDVNVVKTVYIHGNMRVDNGTIKLGSLANSTFGNLSVTGNVFFFGGTFEAKVNGTVSSVERDLWICSGTFTYTCDGAVVPTVLYPPSGGVAGRSWSVIESGAGISGDSDLCTSSGWDFLYDNPRTKMSIHKLS